MKIVLRFSSWGFLLATVFVLSGCASGGSSTINQPFSVKLSQFKSVSVEVKSTLVNPPDTMDEFLEQLQSRIIVELRSQKAFEKIYSAAETDSHSDIRILVTITKVRDVDNSDRVMWGALAGQAKTSAMVEVTDSGGKLIGSFSIEGVSSNGSVLAGTTPQSVDRVADEVVIAIVKNL